MRIAFITFEYPPFIMGGAGVYALNITRELTKLGHQVVVFTPHVNDLVGDRCDSNLKIKEVRLNNRLPFKALQFWLRLPKILENESEGKFDVVHFNGLSYWSLKKKLSDAPHVVTIHHLVKDIRKNNISDLILGIKYISSENSLFIPFVEKNCIKYADKVIAVSNFTGNQTIETYKVPSDKIEVVYNGIDLNGYVFSNYELEKIKKQLNLIGKQVLLFVGRVDDPRKDLDVLLKALKKVSGKIGNIFLLVVGKGNQNKVKKIAEALNISGNIFFTGFVDEVTLKKYYSICDIYICPSRLEGFGLTILEAMAVGKPIIATNVGAIPEIIGDCGVLIDSDNAEMLSDAIMKILHKDTNNFREKALDRVKEFTWNKAAKRTLNIYNKLN